MKKKILFVIDSLHSGGAEKSLVSLLSMLDYSKYEVDLLLFKKEGLYLPLIPKEVVMLDIPKYFIYDEIKSEKKDFKIEIARIKNSIAIRNPLCKKRYHSAQITCKNILKVLENNNKEYDVAIAYSQGFPTYYVADKVYAKKKLCWVNTDYKNARYNKKFDYGYYSKFNNIIAVSEKNKEVLIEVYPEFRDRIVVIYDIISQKLVRDMSNNDQVYNDDYKGVRILTIGRHVHLKGYDMAIEAAMLLKKNNIDFRWFSIGEGILTKELHEKVKEYNLENEFVFLGTYTNPYPFIKGCDVYCQPSRFEGFGMAIAEAKILNKPIVATDFEIVHDQIKDGVNGVIVGMNAEEIYLGIKKIINNEDLKSIILDNLLMEKIDTESELKKVYSLICL